MKSIFKIFAAQSKTESEERLNNMDETIDTIAKLTLGLETLETRNMDSLDFHEFSVGNIKAALREAYLAGQKHGEAATPLFSLRRRANRGTL